MNTAVIMRNSKVRTFLYVLLGCCMMFTVFLLSSTHTKLKDSQESNDKCQQQRDSLSAQLQVVYEHKSRLEKTLQLETTDRKKAEDAVKTIRDQSERDRADARNKIRSLEKELEELKNATRNMTQAAAVQAEEFKNLKTSFDTLHQEKEKVDNELANHITLLQQEKDSRQKLERHLMELQEARKTQGQLELLHQKELETCRVETAQLYAKLQQQNMVHPQQLVASAGRVRPASSGGLLEADAHRVAQADGAAVLPAQAATEAKANAKEDKGAGKMGSRYQGAGAESRQPKVVGGMEANNDVRAIARNPDLAKQVLELPVDPAVQQPVKGSSLLGQPGKVAAAAANSLSRDVAPPLQPKDKPNHGNSQVSALPQEQPAGHVPLAVSQPGAVKAALQPAVVAQQPSRPPAEPQPLARPAVQPAVQEIQQGELQPGSHLGPLPDADVPPLNPDQREEVGRGSVKAKAAPLPVVHRIPRPGQPAAMGQSWEQQPAGDLAEQAPVNQVPPVLPPPNIVKMQPSDAGVNEAAGVDKAAGASAKAANSHLAPAAANKKDADAAAALEEENEVKDGPNHKAMPLGKPANNAQDFLLGPGNGKEPMARLERPNQQQLGVRGAAGDDDLDYGNAAVKDDDAAEDQEDDGPFGAVGDLGRGKPMPDAADFDDQGPEADPVQLQQQQPNNLHEDGIAANPK